MMEASQFHFDEEVLANQTWLADPQLLGQSSSPLNWTRGGATPVKGNNEDDASLSSLFHAALSPLAKSPVRSLGSRRASLEEEAAAEAMASIQRTPTRKPSGHRDAFRREPPRRLSPAREPPPRLSPARSPKNLTFFQQALSQSASHSARLRGAPPPERAPPPRDSPPRVVVPPRERAPPPRDSPPRVAVPPPPPADEPPAPPLDDAEPPPPPREEPPAPPNLLSFDDAEPPPVEEPARPPDLPSLNEDAEPPAAAAAAPKKTKCPRLSLYLAPFDQDTTERMIKAGYPLYLEVKIPVSRKKNRLASLYRRLNARWSEITDAKLLLGTSDLKPGVMVYLWDPIRKRPHDADSPTKRASDKVARLEEELQQARHELAEAKQRRQQQEDDRQVVTKRQPAPRVIERPPKTQRRAQRYDDDELLSTRDVFVQLEQQNAGGPPRWPSRQPSERLAPVPEELSVEPAALSRAMTPGPTAVLDLTSQPARRALRHDDDAPAAVAEPPAAEHLPRHDDPTAAVAEPPAAEHLPRHDAPTAAVAEPRAPEYLPRHDAPAAVAEPPAPEHLPRHDAPTAAVAEPPATEHLPRHDAPTAAVAEPPAPSLDQLDPALFNSNLSNLPWLEDPSNLPG